MLSAATEGVGGAGNELIGRLWSALLVNTLFFTGIAQAGIVFSAIYRTTRSRWSPGLERLGFSGIRFLPISLLLLAVLFLGHQHLYSWTHEPLPEAKRWWLSSTFFFARQFFYFGVMTLLSFGYYRLYLRPESEERWNKMGVFAPWLIFAYAVFYSLIAFDMLMSLEPEWYSNLFGAYFFISNLYAAMAFLAFVAALRYRRNGFTKEISVDSFHDIGKLIFGFCCVTADFLWSQYIVIYYGNLPEEVGYVLKRTATSHWGGMGIVVLLTAFVIPFIVLISREVKRHPRVLIYVVGLILVGIHLVDYLLVLPAVVPNASIRFPTVEWIFSAGFAFLYAGIVRRYLREAPGV
ncbi:MAG: hypothetical protein D6679_06120 [Candidatus Hydrogenedentota bacterium]|nr:MAG: hypothetical protein D6679_06120 [Candidatus Hydrogenedentota bacterium]